MTSVSRKLLFDVAIAFAFFLMLAPVVMIVVTSFFAQEIVSFPPEGWSFHWYSNLWNQREFAGGFLVSFQVAIAAVLIGVPCGTAAALAPNRSNIPAKGALSALDRKSTRLNSSH